MFDDGISRWLQKKMQKLKSATDCELNQTTTAHIVWSILERKATDCIVLPTSICVHPVYVRLEYDAKRREQHRMQLWTHIKVTNHNETGLIC
jgi:hypothetical protein